jgi:hypothetical protein
LPYSHLCADSSSTSTQVNPKNSFFDKPEGERKPLGFNPANALGKNDANKVSSELWSRDNSVLVSLCLGGFIQKYSGYLAIMALLRDRVLISVRLGRSCFGFRQAQKIRNSGSMRYFLCEV